MSDFVVSIFKLDNDSGYRVPKLGILYREADTGNQWHINCGGTRAYLVRIGENLIDTINEQAADSHFMISRVISALFLAGAGLYTTEVTGRLFIHNLEQEEFNFVTDLDLTKVDQEDYSEMVKEFEDWYQFICSNLLFRRVADDMCSALSNPIESDLFIYRGMEWLMKATSIGWKDLAGDMSIKYSELRKYKQTVNATHGQRHGIKSGLKGRGSRIDCASLVADLLYGFGNGRKRVDPSFNGFTPERASEIVKKAMPSNPYP